jgi:hypothetical protein
MRKERDMERRRVPRGSILFGLVLIGIGVVLLLRSLDVVPETVRVWPILLLAVGLWILLVRLTGWWGHFGGFAAPLVLLAIGGMLVLRDAGAIDPDVAVWPVVLIAVGLGILLEAALGRRERERGRTTSVSVPLDAEARSARLVIRHGAGRLRMAAGAGSGMLIEGTVAGEVTPEVRREDGRMEVTLRPERGWGHAPIEWDLGLTGDVPLALELRTGADETILDLSGLVVEDLSVETGASKTEVVLPSRGRCRVRVKAGAASVVMTVPTQTAARIRSRTGLASVEVDEGRFPSSPEGWTSPTFDAADDRVEIDLEGGAASFTVR